MFTRASFSECTPLAGKKDASKSAEPSAEWEICIQLEAHRAATQQGSEGSAAKIADDKGREDEGANAACNLAVRPTLQPQSQPLVDSIR